MIRGRWRRYRRSILLLVGAGIVAGFWALWSPPKWLLDALPGCLYRVQTSAPRVALTIDDGPDGTTTPMILKELKRNQSQATFFLISSRVPGNESVVRDLVRGGHEIGNHLTQDVASIRLSAAEFDAELIAAHSTLAVFGPVTWVRPASGWYSPRMLETMRRRGYHCALGSVYPFDVTIQSAGFARSHILRNAGPGAIIILHDGGRLGHRTAEVLHDVLPELKRRGLQVVTLSQLAEEVRCKK